MYPNDSSCYVSMSHIYIYTYYIIYIYTYSHPCIMGICMNIYIPMAEALLFVPGLSRRRGGGQSQGH